MTTFAYIIGILTVITSLAVKIIGYPAQIFEIKKKMSVEGISLTLSTTSFITYICWTIHGILQNDNVIIIGQSLGVLMSGIVLWQVIIYRKKR